MALSDEDLSRVARRIGHQIRALRKAKKLTQTQLAELAGLHPKFMGAVERGETTLTVNRLFQVAAALEVSITTLLEPAGEFTAPIPKEELLSRMTVGLREMSEGELFALYSYGLFLQMNFATNIDHE